MSFNNYQDLMKENIKILDKIRNTIFKKKSTLSIMNSNLESVIPQLKWFVKKMDYQTTNRCPRYVNQYEVFYCDLGNNVRSELNKKRPCVIIKSFSNSAIVAPIRHGKMTGYDQANHSITITSDDGTTRQKSLATHMFPVKEDTTFTMNVRNWRRNPFTGCIDVGNLRAISNYRLNKLPIGKIHIDSIKKLDEELFKIMSIDKDNIYEYTQLKNNYNLSVQSHSDLQNQYDELVQSHSDLQNQYDELIQSQSDLQNQYDELIQSRSDMQN